MCTWSIPVLSFSCTDFLYSEQFCRWVRCPKTTIPSTQLYRVIFHPGTPSCMPQGLCLRASICSGLAVPLSPETSLWLLFSGSCLFLSLDLPFFCRAAAFRGFLRKHVGLYRFLFWRIEPISLTGSMSVESKAGHKVPSRFLQTFAPIEKWMLFWFRSSCSLSPAFPNFAMIFLLSFLCNVLFLDFLFLEPVLLLAYSGPF